jgi:hypothetical protein
MPSKSISQESAVLGTMTGVYYRHEFARRHQDVDRKHDVVAASLNLLAQFPKTARRYAKAKKYVQSEQRRTTLTDSMIDDLKSARSDKKRTAMRHALAEFLTKYRVLPVPPPSCHGSFLSYPLRRGDIPEPSNVTVSAEESLFEYTRIQYFETYALSELKMPHPVFLPVVLLGGTRSRWIKAVDALTQTDATEENRFRIVVINADNPAITVADNLTALRLCMSLQDDGTPTEDDDETGNPRARCDKFNKYLAAHDAGKRPTKGEILDVVRNHVSPSKWAKHQSDGTVYDWAYGEFARWRSKASDLIKSYPDII